MPPSTVLAVTTLAVAAPGVPYGYLISAIGGVWFAFCAVAPRRRPHFTAWATYLSGMVINEVPSVGIYYLVLTTVLAATSGDLASPVGWAAFGLSALAVAGLLFAALRATRAGPVLDTALAEGLGADWRDAVDARTRGRLRPGFSVGLLTFVPASARRFDVTRVAGLSYGDAGRHNLLDLYHHRSRRAGCPVLVHLHGGGLHSGRKSREAMSLVYGLAARGWVCVSANYRLSPAATFPDHLVDVKKAIAWLRAHGEEYGADPATIFVAGGSAGGQLAALAGLTANDPRYQPGFEDADTSVAGAVPLYGLYGPRSIGAPDSHSWDACPVLHLRPDAPPFLVVHGDHDSLLAVEGARQFVEELRAVSHNPVVYAELPGAQHSFDRFRSVRCDNVVNAIESFGAWVLASERVR